MNKLLLDRLKDINLLVVEDDEIALYGLKQGLKKYCKTFFCASDGMDGIDVYKNNNIDIIITDIHLPVLNGLDMMNEILKINPNQKFIVMTSYDSDKNILTSIHNGACLFLKKPIEIEMLQTQLLFIGLNNRQLVRLSKTIEVDPSKEIIYKNSEILTLTYKNNKIFWLFFNNLNKIVRYSVIQDYIYDNEYVSQSAIRMVISRLSDIVGKESIENVSGVGYKMISS